MGSNKLRRDKMAGLNVDWKIVWSIVAAVIILGVIGMVLKRTGVGGTP